MEESQIQKFYKGCNVFVTGGTGFMGKILIEKLLRSTEIDTLYLLIREKKGKSIETRLDELFDNVLFDRLKKESCKFRHRVEALQGDCSITGLGLSISDRHTLISKVNIIFHVAATVRFDENLKLSYNINVKGTKDIIDLAKQMHKLKSIMHVSTAYSNCYRDSIEEKFYDSPISYEDVGAVLEKITEHQLDWLTPKILGQWPNTYSFTKALAENMIKDVGNGLPLGIFRPSIVISTAKEPIEGWIDNMYGPTGVSVGALSGIMRVGINDGHQISDLVPVDLCVSSLISSAWDVGTKTCDRTVDNISVYNYVSSVDNPITWKEFQELNVIQADTYPAVNSIWYPCLHTTSSWTWYRILTLVYHILPAVFIDFVAIVMGKKPRMLMIYKKIHKFTAVTTYFAMRTWHFTNDNVMKMWTNMNETDRQLFPFHMKDMHWLGYCRTYMRGVRRYLLKEDDSTLEKAKKRNERFRIMNTVLEYTFLFGFFYLVISIMSWVYNILF